MACHLISPAYDVIPINQPDGALPPNHRVVRWRGRSLFSGYQVEVEAYPMTNNARINNARNSRFSYAVKVDEPCFRLPLDAGFDYRVFARPVIDSVLVGNRTLVYECTGRPLPQSLMTDAEEADTIARLGAPLAGGEPMNIAVIGGTGAGKSELVNRIYQVITGNHTSIAPTSDITGSLTNHLLCYRISPSLNLFDYRGFHLHGAGADANFGAYRQIMHFILQGQVAPHKYVNGVLTQGAVHANNRIHGVIFVQTLEDHAVVEGAAEKRRILMSMLAELGIPHVTVKTRVDEQSIGRLPRVNLTATPEDSLRLSELADAFGNNVFPVAKYVNSVRSPDNQQHRRLVLRAMRALMLNIQAVRGM